VRSIVPLLAIIGVVRQAHDDSRGGRVLRRPPVTLNFIRFR
jgi:hypothetical protein